VARRLDDAIYLSKSEFFAGIGLAMNFSELEGRGMRLSSFDERQPKMKALLLNRFMSAAILRMAGVTRGPADWPSYEKEEVILTDFFHTTNLRERRISYA
jgi:hypothetical protein